MLSKGGGDVVPPQLREDRLGSSFWHLCTRGVALAIAWGKPVSPGDPCNASTPINVHFTLRPRSPEEWEWIQGLLLALSEGSLGDSCPRGDRGARLPQLQGPLARCTILSITLSRHQDDLADLVLLPMFHIVGWEEAGTGKVFVEEAEQ